jgi:DNA-binding MarR family transcriptional regulator
MAARQPARTAAGEALFAVMLETQTTFFRLRAAGAKFGAATSWGGGAWGFLRSLKVEGPRTVAQFARGRLVSRQHIQKLAYEMEEAGLIEFFVNPTHRRSPLMRLTARGEARVRRLGALARDFAESIVGGMSEKKLKVAAGVLRSLRDRLEHGAPKQNGGLRARTKDELARRRKRMN